MERRLTAIMAADVVGFSTLMGSDEAGTLERLKALRKELVEQLIKSHGGRVVKLMGDGLLAEFPSVVEGVQCAAGIQEEMADRNSDIPEDDRIRLRIGVNLGDVIVEGRDIYGDGVNVAARLEALAAPGGLCISGAAFDAIEGKLGLPFEDCGLQKLKNIAKPLRVYQLAFPAPGAKAAMAATGPPQRPNKPSIAVLPFDNMSGDPEQEYFSDGVVEDIITTLSAFRSILVIARNSSFAYKGKATDIKLVGQELGVRYVLEGSVRKSSSRVRITAQLIEAATGHHLWAERYDRVLEDVFDLQDEITETIVSAIQPELEVAEQERARKKSPEELGAWELYQRGMWHANRIEDNEMEAAESCFNDALAHTPGYAPALTGLAWLDFLRVLMYFTTPEEIPRSSLLKRGLERAETAVRADERDAFAQFVHGRLLSLVGEFDQSTAQLKLAIKMNPNHAQSYHGLGYTYAVSGRPEDAVDCFNKALRLSPRDPYRWAFLTMKSMSLVMCRQYDEAIEVAHQAIRVRPDVFWAYVHLTNAYARSGRVAEAKQTFAKLKDLMPNFDRTAIDDTVWFKHTVDQEFFLEGLRLAGMEA